MLLRADIDSLLNEYQVHRSTSVFLDQVLQTVRRESGGAVPRAPFLRNLNHFLLSGDQIQVVVNDTDEPHLLITKTTTTAQVVVLCEPPTQFNPPLASDQLRLTLLSEKPDEWQLFSGYTGPWASCMMELLLLEIKTTVDLAYRRRCTRYLRLLSNEHGVLPPSFMLYDAVKHGDHPVAAGGFADVWKGVWQDSTVCLKVIRLYASSNRKKLMKQFCREALVWKLLDHPNVLPLLGVSMDFPGPSFCLVSPWMARGNVIDFLEQNPNYDRFSVLLDVAHGMKYIHEQDPPIVHGDIRGANILVTDEGRCCLCDFGLASVAESSSFGVSSNNSGGCIRWMAPEVLLPTDETQTKHKPARDIYAFACTALEIFSGKPPFHWLTPEVAVIPRIIAGVRPPRPPELTSDSLWELVERCWAHRTTQRPSASEVVALLEATTCPSKAAELSPEALSGSSEYYTPRSDQACSLPTDPDDNLQHRRRNWEEPLRVQTYNLPAFPSLDSPVFESDCSDSPVQPEYPTFVIRRHSDTQPGRPVMVRARSLSLPAYLDRVARSFPFIHRRNPVQYENGTFPYSTSASCFTSPSIPSRSKSLPSPGHEFLDDDIAWDAGYFQSNMPRIHIAPDEPSLVLGEPSPTSETGRHLQLNSDILRWRSHSRFFQRPSTDWPPETDERSMQRGSLLLKVYSQIPLLPMPLDAIPDIQTLQTFEDISA